MAREKVDAKQRENIEAVRKALRKQAPLSAKQGCSLMVALALHALLRPPALFASVLFLWWRRYLRHNHIIADEFNAELSDGVAYIAGHDDEARPVVVFRIKQDYPKFHSQKSFVRLLVFTLEVAVACMSRFVDQFVLLFDAMASTAAAFGGGRWRKEASGLRLPAAFFRSASAFLNLLMGTLKIVADYYPGRLHRAFVIDPPSLFSVLWGVRPFVELAPATAVVCSLDFEDSLEDASFTAYPRTASLRFEPAAALLATGKAAWAPPRRGSPPSLVGASPLSARSFSFASPAARSTTTAPIHRGGVPLTPFSTKGHKTPSAPQQFPRTPRPSFLQSPSMLFAFRKDGQASRGERERESFLPFLRFYRRPYDEISYRAKMGRRSAASSPSSTRRPTEQAGSAAAAATARRTPPPTQQYHQHLHQRI
ncbi:hypothetical protein GUJ93_ZPchr0013g35888 [Zizania palustris]|uniref:CRAL-TRIO domain-containing protein n=1 Tax=Zizania palustris TaxID=103762 RepID=A0A8J5WTZ5_ZIZPA|nr:hypothetical protein GUJ93_ZPchr0013g35888 [Zizania palustris]